MADVPNTVWKWRDTDGRFVIRDDRWEKFITSDKSFQQTDQLTCTVLTVQIILSSRNVAGKILAARNHEAETTVQMRERLDASRWNYTNEKKLRSLL